MKDTLPETESMALELGKLLEDHKGSDIVVLDMRSLNFWTDFFVIASVTSSAHLSGLERHIKDYSRNKGIEPRRSRKPDIEDEWCLIDLGNLVVHLMTSRSRSFYELERLWSSAPVIYSSKSSSKSTPSS
ncbi:ribosome silencing factor [Leadbettera azotonutricia]|nr:ribosome silencing factor [Leadbettera azotonutricia]